MRWAKLASCGLALLAAGTPLSDAAGTGAPFDDMPRASLPEPGDGASSPVAHACLAGLSQSELPASLPGDLREAASLYSAKNRTNDLDSEATLSVIALASALGEPVTIESILTYREERVDICLFDRLTSFEAQSVLSALTLGYHQPIESLRALVPDRHVVARFDSFIDQRVDLDTDLAFRALALHGSGIEVHLDDVLDIQRTAQVELTYEARTTFEKRDALLAQALRR